MKEYHFGGELKYSQDEYGRSGRIMRKATGKIPTREKVPFEIKTALSERQLVKKAGLGWVVGLSSAWRALMPSGNILFNKK